ncbi:MAG: creatininase family protein [Rhodobacteraceae bacterium]|nr:creatininase family protein [Paracoccaceae bacterium]
MPIVEWAHMKAQEVQALAAENTVVILPVASIEQHGPHLPVMTDTRLGHEVAIRAANKAWSQRKTLVAPVIWSGLSEHHMAYGGTLTISHATFRALLTDLIQAITRHGFRDILISNSHGGNDIALKSLLDELAPTLDATLVATTYVMEAGDRYHGIMEDQKSIMHAGEGETSMMMVCEPGLVDTSDLAALNVPSTGGPAFLGAGRASYRWRPLPHVTPNGVIGAPEKANVEKGEKLLDIGAQSLAELIIDPATWAAPQDLRNPQNNEDAT